MLLRSCTTLILGQNLVQKQLDTKQLAPADGKDDPSRSPDKESEFLDGIPSVNGWGLYGSSSSQKICNAPSLSRFPLDKLPAD